MGGYGSGGWNRSGRGTVEEHRSLTIGRLRQAGALEPGWYGGLQWTVDGERVADIRLVGGHDVIRLSYRARAREGPWQEVDESVRILWRPCRFGGERPFFSCPGCARPVLKVTGAGVRFRCRRCCRLGYASSREREHDRSLRQANRLRQRLGGEPGMAYPIAARPKGMHQGTYKRLVSKIIDREAVADDYAALLLQRLERQSARSTRSFWS
jgi:hypothetical protein